MGQAAADRPAVADLEVPDLGHRVGHERTALGDDARLLDGALACHAADGHPAVVDPDVGQAGHLVEVDQVGGPHEAKVQERHQTLPAGQDLRLVAVLGEQRQRLVEGRGRQVFEAWWLYSRTSTFTGVQ